MSTKATDSLFELIKSLSKSEKRYFKLVSSRHTIGEVNNYVLLFDFLDDLEEYDEYLVFKTFNGHAFLNKFSITKKRLYDHILMALTQFHATHHTEATIYKMLHGSTILYEKALYSQAKKVLKSAEKLAHKHQLTNLLIEIRKQTKKLFEIDNYFDLEELELNEIQSEDQLFHAQSKFEDDLWAIKSKVFQRLSHQGNARNSEDIQHYKDIYEEYLSLQKPTRPTSEGTYLQFHVLSAYFFAINDWNSTLEYLQKNHQLFNDQPILIEDHPNRYFSILTNLIYTSDQLGLEKLTTDYLLELRKLHMSLQDDAYQDLRTKLFSTLASIELSYYTKRGDYQILLNKIPSFESEIQTYEAGISEVRKAFIHFKIATVHLAMGDGNSAQKSIRKLLNQTYLDKKEDIVAYAHLIELITQLENQKFDLIPHLAKVTQRFLKAKNRYGVLEKEIVSTCVKISACSNKFDQQEKWSDLVSKLEQLSKEGAVSDQSDYFHWKLWALAKSTNASFVQLVKENSHLRLKAA